MPLLVPYGSVVGQTSRQCSFCFSWASAVYFVFFSLRECVLVKAAVGIYTHSFFLYSSFF